jgi:hypothetical protein
MLKMFKMLQRDGEGEKGLGRFSRRTCWWSGTDPVSGGWELGHAWNEGGRAAQTRLAFEVRDILGRRREKNQSCRQLSGGTIYKAL